MSKFSWVTSAKKSDGGKAMVRHLCLASRAWSRAGLGIITSHFRWR